MTAEQLEQFGLNLNQAKAYIALLNTESLTPPELSSQIGVTRTNAYELTDQLVTLDLASKEQVGGKTAYRAKSPTMLRQLIQKRQREVRQQQEVLDGILPALLSTFRLTQDQPGLLYLEGKTGLISLFDDIIRAKEEVLIIPSNFDRDDSEMAAAIDEQIARQVKAQIPVRTIYPAEEVLETKDLDQLKANLVDVRFYPMAPLSAQVMVYGVNVAFSTYRHGVVTTVITNPDIAESMRLVFEGMWQKAEPSDVKETTLEEVGS